MISEARSAAEAVVVVEASENVGTGVIIASNSRNSWVITCAHVFEDKEPIVKVGRRTFAAKVEKTDDKVDLALLRTPKLPRNPLGMASDLPGLYDDVMLLGYNDGQVIATRATFCGTHPIENSLTLAGGVTIPGSSGGPVIDDDGSLIGIVKEITRHDSVLVWGLASAVSLKDLTRFLDKTLCPIKF